MSSRSTLAVAILALMCSANAENPRQQQAPPPSTPPMIVQNPDGTLTVQKEPPNGAKPGTGLVIPRQIVIPLIPAVRKSKGC